MGKSSVHAERTPGPAERVFTAGAGSLPIYPETSLRVPVSAAAFSAIALSACVSSGGADAIKPIASDVSESSHVKTVVLTSAPVGVDAAFRDRFVAAVQSRLSGCAKGARPLRLELAVQDFHGSNGFKTWALGDSNHVRGSARLVDPASGVVVADYDVNRSVGGGGLIAAVAMGNPDQQMGVAFGDEVCKQAFIRR